MTATLATGLPGLTMTATLATGLQVDAVVLVVGLTSEGVKGGNDEAEGHDRSTLVMPAHQDALVAAVSAAAA